MILWKQTCWNILESVSGSKLSLLYQLATGGGNAVKGTCIEKSSPARTVMSRTALRSIQGLFGCSSTTIPTLGRLGGDVPTSLTARTRKVYSSPGFKLLT